MRQRTGYVFEKSGKWYARVTWIDPEGNRRELKRTGRDEHHARELLESLLTEREQLSQPDRTPAAPESPVVVVSNAALTVTFSQLAEAYKAHKVKPAQYRNDRKIAGLRSERTVKLRIAALVSHFGQTDIKAITVASIERYKLDRLDTRTKNGTDRAIASVNRELETLRAMLRFAVNEGLLDRSPFERASTPLISKADETRRTRVLTREEERKLLAQCVGARAHLRALVIAAVDTGMRKGELLALRWLDVSITAKTITVRAVTTKTLQTRTVPLSERLLKELNRIPFNGDRNERIFKLTKFQNAWASACKDAGIADLRYHDLRATYITRLIEEGLPAEIVAKLSGHSQISTLYGHYLRNTSDAVERAKQILDRLNR